MKGALERRRWRPGQSLGLPLFVASILCSIVFPAHAENALTVKKPASSRKAGLTIRIAGGEWGNIRRDELETLLYAVADELLARVPHKLSSTVVVSPTDRSPAVLYERGQRGEYLVELHAKGPRWHLYAYEFAHELCHIVSNYEENVGADVTRYNQWFEEALCETASLYVLRGLAARWEIAAPSPEWAERSLMLGRFAERLVSEEHRRLPADKHLTGWLLENEATLRHDPYLREKNEVVANLLLPLFERYPGGWEAVGYLNRGRLEATASLEEYLGDWYASAPLEHRRFIGDVLGLLGVELRGANTLARAVKPHQELPPLRP